MNVRIWVGAAVAMLAGTPWMAFAESMRCGKWVVNEESTPAEIMEKCGAPLAREENTEDVFGKNPAGYRFKTGTTTIERWYYQKGPGSFRMQVTIVDGDVRHIDRVPE
jgi:hypothetical protein